MEKVTSYVKYVEWNRGKLEENKCLLMSAREFVEGGENVMGVAVTITPYGDEPEETDPVVLDEGRIICS